MALVISKAVYMRLPKPKRNIVNYGYGLQIDKTIGLVGSKSPPADARAKVVVAERRDVV